MDRNAAILVIEDSDEFEPGAKRFEILAQRRYPDVVSVFEFGDRTLGDVEPTGELRLADSLAMAELEQTDLLKRLGAHSGDPLGRAVLGGDVVTKGRELGSCHQINPSVRSSSRYSS